MLDFNIGKLVYKMLFIYIFYAALFGIVSYMVEHFFWHYLNKKWSKFAGIWARFTLIAWGFLILKFVYFLWHLNYQIVTFVIIISLALGWDIWRNLYAGLWMKFARYFKVGEIISFGDTKGEIKSIQWMNITVESISGVELQIPNSLFLKNFLKEESQSNTLNVYKINWCTQLKIDKLALEESLKLCPFISNHNHIIILENEKQCFEISAPLISPKFTGEVTRYLDEYFEVNE